MTTGEVRPLRAYAEVALGRQRSPVHERGDHMVRYLRAANVKDGELSLDDVKTMNFTPDEQRIYSLRTGDVLVTEGSGSLAAVGASAVWGGEIDGTVCFQNTLLRLRPGAGTDARYLAWWCRYAFGSGLFAAEATGANIYHLSANRVRAIGMARLGLAEQRAIADFLDVETARIDALITKKRRLITLLEEQWLSMLCDRLQVPRTSEDPSDLWVSAELRAGWMSVPMRRLVSLVRNGDWGSPAGEDECDATCVRAADFEFAKLEATQGVTRSYGESTVRAHALSPGAMVMEKSGGGEDTPVGRVVAWRGTDNAVPTNFAGGLEAADSVDSLFVLLVFRAAYCIGLPWRSIKQTTGLQNLDTTHYLSHRWALPPLPQQSRIAADLESALARVLSATAKLDRQVTLLQEKRQALITSAVTGEMSVPGVAA